MREKDARGRGQALARALKRAERDSMVPLVRATGQCGDPSMATDLLAFVALAAYVLYVWMG